MNSRNGAMREVMTPAFRRKPKITDGATRRTGNEEHSEEEYYVARHEVHECIERRRLDAEEQALVRRQNPK